MDWSIPDDAYYWIILYNLFQALEAKTFGLSLPRLTSTFSLGAHAEGDPKLSKVAKR